MMLGLTVLAYTRKSLCIHHCISPEILRNVHFIGHTPVVILLDNLVPHRQNLVNDLEMVQHRAVRFVKNLYGQQSITAMLRDLNWETLAQRRLKAQVTMTYKIANGLVCIQPTQLISSIYSTRSLPKGGFRQLAITSNYYKYSFS